MAQENNELEKKAQEYLNNWKRERADFLNYKKDELERTLSAMSRSKEKFILDLLPILDNLYLVQKHSADNGLSQVIRQFEDFLTKEGIGAIETAGKIFDPNLMEAVSGDGEIVAEEVQRGYIMNEKVLRPAKVIIAK